MNNTQSPTDFGLYRLRFVGPPVAQDVEDCSNGQDQQRRQGLVHLLVKGQPHDGKANNTQYGRQDNGNLQHKHKDLMSQTQISTVQAEGGHPDCWREIKWSLGSAVN